MNYNYWRENPFPERFFFIKGDSSIGVSKSHHIHVIRKESDFRTMQILFRDYLRKDKAAAEEYESLKIELAKKFPKDRDNYTNGKTVFVNKILEKAGFKKL